MSHGVKDWAQNAAVNTIYNMQDLGEHAVRTGSIVSYHRTGNVIWMDDMEDNINKWVVQPNGTGAAAALSTAEAHTGSQSMKLTGGSDGGKLISIDKHLPLPILSKIGFETTLINKGNIDKIWIDMFLYDGSFVHQARLQVKVSPGEIATFMADGSYQVVSSIPDFPNISTAFQNIKWIIDYKNENYGSAIFFRQTYDMSGIAYNKKAVVSDPRLSLSIVIISNAGTNGIAYIDNVIITENE